MRFYNLLPTALVCLLDIIFVTAQNRELALNEITSGNSTNGQTFTIPVAESLVLSVATCAQDSGVRFLVSDTSSTNTPIAGGGDGSIEIPLKSGLGTFRSRYPNGGVLRIEGRGSFEIGLSDTNRGLHDPSSELPFFGDSTANQAILFSHQFSLPSEKFTPKYPNYTMHPVDLPQDSTSQTIPNYTLSIFPTTDQDYPRSRCFLASQSQIGGDSLTSDETAWLRDEAEGWRMQYVVRGLSPATNYTAYILEPARVLGPIYFVTKSAAFPCSLVANLPYCPRVAYAVPLSAPPGGDDIYTGSTLPEPVRGPLRSYLTNFTVSLGRFACGRDLYSPLVDCIDCQREYRKWLCAISLPRCSEPSPSNPDGFTALPPDPTATGLAASKNGQQVLSALVPIQTSTPPRNANLPPFNSPYQMLLPCIEACNSVDRACPPFLGFKCPTSNYNGASSYGIGYIDGKDGDEKEGITGTAQDRYGNVWCASA